MHISHVPESQTGELGKTILPSLNDECHISRNLNHILSSSNSSDELPRVGAERCHLPDGPASGVIYCTAWCNNITTDMYFHFTGITIPMKSKYRFCLGRRVTHITRSSRVPLSSDQLAHAFRVYTELKKLYFIYLCT